MISKIYFKIIVTIASTLAIVNCNIVTLDGQCPTVPNSLVIDIKPILKQLEPVTLNSIAETAPLSGMNRTDVIVKMELSKLPGAYWLTRRFRSKESGQCEDIEVLFKESQNPGVYDILYQVTPNTNFVPFVGGFLSINPKTLSIVGYDCHNLPNSQYQAEILVFSANNTEYDKSTQEEVKNILEVNNLGNLYQYLGEIERINKCQPFS